MHHEAVSTVREIFFLTKSDPQLAIFTVDMYFHFQEFVSHTELVQALRFCFGTNSLVGAHRRPGGQPVVQHELS